MSDDDAATEKKNADAEETAQADRQLAGTDADTTVGAAQDAPENAPAPAAEEGSAEGDTEETVKLPTSSPKEAPAEDAAVESSKSEDATVKLSSGEKSGKSENSAKAAAKPEAQKDASGGGRGWVPVAAAFAAGVVVVAAAAAGVVFWKQAHDRGNELDARNSAVAAACDFGHQVGTYDAKNFDDYIKRVKDRSTGDWLTQFDGASTALKQITQQAQARSTVGEIHCAYESGNENKAAVVMLITQNQSKAATPQPQPLTIGVVASLQKKDGKWMVDNFQSPMTNDLQAGGAQAPSADSPQPAPGNATPQPGN